MNERRLVGSTAMAALTYSARPDLNVRAVMTIIQQGCDDIGEPGNDIRTGHGRVNFGRSMELARGWKG